jgi:hypothetical protein
MPSVFVTRNSLQDVLNWQYLHSGNHWVAEIALFWQQSDLKVQNTQMLM